MKMYFHKIMKVLKFLKVQEFKNNITSKYFNIFNNTLSAS